MQTSPAPGTDIKRPPRAFAYPSTPPTPFSLFTLPLKHIRNPLDPPNQLLSIRRNVLRRLRRLPGAHCHPIPAHFR
jgi:hypothetical protein